MSRTHDQLGSVIDADGHVIEVDRELFDYLPPPYREYSRLLAYPFFPTLDGFHRAARKAADGTRVTSLEIPTADDWLAFLDDANIAVSVLFPTAGLAYGLIKDPDWAAGLARAYNDWLHDRFVRPAHARLKAIALIPLQDPPRAVAELRHAVEDLGMVGAVLPAAGLKDAFGDRSFWPVYEAAQDLGCMLAVHGAPSDGLGLDRLRRLIEVRTLTHPFSQFVQMTSMMFGGVFDAFPRLKVAFCEAGSGWLPYLLERLEMEFAHRRPQAPDLNVPPSEHLRSGRIFVHAELAEAGLSYAVQKFGDDLFFCASDYPHEPKEDFSEALGEFAARTDLSDATRRKIVWDNPIRLYGLDEAQLRQAAGTAEVVA